ncbi:hypothetical protein CN264_19040 [Bacillus cereus]|uniref:AAA family ATPase n=1 Tax=Bacillus cereus TaxID=1396 RepID=UPI000BF8B0B0|nr:AAA family ATPase [Bacillus cereus]PFC23505.1 hypothetical protein CN264_19040 [Bacillus cereus]
MRLTIKNIGLVKEADIKLEGLTIIAGENDTGKSTVGKTLFSIIKGMNNHHKDFKEAKLVQLEEAVDIIYFKYREIVKEFSDGHVRVKPSLYPPVMRRELLHFLNMEDYYALDEYISDYKFQIERELFKLSISKSKDFEMAHLFNHIDQIVKELQEPDHFLVDTLKLALKSEFGTDICNKSTKKESMIKYEENRQLVVQAYLFNEEIVDSKYPGGPLEIEDVTYIESPLTFQMHKIISEASTFSSDRKIMGHSVKKSRKNLIPFHMKDLISKMSESSYYTIDLDSVLFENELFDDMVFENDHQTFIDDISGIIDGESVLDKDLDEFLFQRKINEKLYSFKTSNVASGIKSFSMIQMLLKAQMMNDRTILIIDEPEIHLHPKWQVKYCEIIAKLASLGIKILVTSHSPYIVQALRVFAKRYEMDSKTNFYLAEKKESGSQILNVNEDLNSIFKKLSDPIQNLLWEN